MRLGGVALVVRTLTSTRGAFPTNIGAADVASLSEKRSSERGALLRVSPEIEGRGEFALKKLVDLFRFSCVCVRMGVASKSYRRIFKHLGVLYFGAGH